MFTLAAATVQMPYLRRRGGALASAGVSLAEFLGNNVPQQNALRALIANVRTMAARYRNWADQASAYQVEEFRQLADASEQSANELEEMLRRTSGV